MTCMAVSARMMQEKNANNQLFVMKIGFFGGGADFCTKHLTLTVDGRAAF